MAEIDRSLVASPLEMLIDIVVLVAGALEHNKRATLELHRLDVLLTLESRAQARIERHQIVGRRLDTAAAATRGGSVLASILAQVPTTIGIAHAQTAHLVARALFASHLNLVHRRVRARVHRLALRIIAIVFISFYTVLLICIFSMVYSCIH